MRNFIFIASLLFIVSSCKTETLPEEDITPVDWKQRMTKINPADSLTTGSSYLAIYSEVYSVTEHRTINLTATVSLRNISSNDTIFITKSDYYNTEGTLIRTYHKESVFLKPHETIEIIIDEKDTHGGSGANFIFEWAHPKNSHEPVFDAVMISTSGQQGISFTTQGVKR
jgi:hypothetical protein